MKTKTLAVSFCVLASLPAMASADAPKGRYTSTAATVRDTQTKVTWQRVLPDVLTECGNDATCTQAQAASYCANLTLATFDDWRLPTRAELESLVDETRYNSAIDGAAFPSTPAVAFWSASTYVRLEDHAWTIEFYSGDAGYGPTSDESRVRCVR